VCASIRPGSTVACENREPFAPSGIFVLRRPPTLSILRTDDDQLIAPRAHRFAVDQRTCSNHRTFWACAHAHARKTQNAIAPRIIRIVAFPLITNRAWLNF